MLEVPNSNLPWMVRAPEDTWIEFEAKAESFDQHDDGGPNEKWSCYRGKFRNIKGKGFTAEDGEDEVPFYLMEVFANCLNEIGEKGWLSMEYQKGVTLEGKTNGIFREND